MKALLHIGLPKTGTSSIQAFCVQNHEFLLKHGLLYPSSGLQGQAHHLFARAFCPSEKEASLGWIEKVDRNQLINNFVAELDEVKPSTVLITSEAFGDVSVLESLIKELNSLALFDSIEVIVYLRRQDEYMEAKYSTDRRAGITDLSTEEYYLTRKGDTNYLWLIQQLERICGKSKIQICLFDKKVIGDSLIKEFFESRLGIFVPDEADTNIVVNTRLTRDALEFLDLVRKAEADRTFSHKIIPLLEKWSESQEDRFNYFYSNIERRKILESQLESNAKIARDYLGRSDGVLFSSNEVKDDWTPYQGIHPSTFLSIVKFIAKSLD